MKTKSLISELIKKDYSINEISKKTGTSIQNVYKHLKEIKKEETIEEIRKKTVYLTNTDIERLSETISIKIISYLK